MKNKEETTINSQAVVPALLLPASLPQNCMSNAELSLQKIETMNLQWRR